MWDITIVTTDKEFEFETVKGNNVIVFVRRGAIEVQGKPVGPQGVAIMKRDDNTKVVITAKEEKSQILILAGEPLDEVSTKPKL
jgi:redox-sensitive bicupin YhaK (pirin superfamily)